ncbi:hypothetical protein D9756_008748 [Leucocoprinus leucothites]|uniref:Uncharacterized protein n=1 Tax=Leucocoprinus leucothites TaxID=201217 RepID=A0A8H5FVS2_9AGAR|nr:hypothetical protein D9756_008748 [Leucoagaricus leucothites]
MPMVNQLTLYLAIMGVACLVTVLVLLVCIVVLYKDKKRRQREARLKPTMYTYVVVSDPSIGSATGSPSTPGTRFVGAESPPKRSQGLETSVDAFLPRIIRVPPRRSSALTEARRSVSEYSFTSTLVEASPIPSRPQTPQLIRSARGKSPLLPTTSLEAPYTPLPVLAMPSFPEPLALELLESSFSLGRTASPS